MKHLRSTIEEYKVLLRSVPSMVIAVFILSVVLMNLLAGRELYRQSRSLCSCRADRGRAARRNADHRQKVHG